MKYEDVKLGMKVIPFQKSLYGKLEFSIMWIKAQEKKQNFLYIVDYHNDVGAWMLNCDADGFGGDFFKETDFEPV